jgi:hypothetical protein
VGSTRDGTRQDGRRDHRRVALSADFRCASLPVEGRAVGAVDRGQEHRPLGERYDAHRVTTRVASPSSAPDGDAARAVAAADGRERARRVLARKRR